MLSASSDSVSKQLVIVGYKIHKSDYIGIENGNIAGCLVGHVHLMTVLNQSDERATHRNNVVIRGGG
ncbi:MAG: hypothetical protein U5K69_09505 [Balneolaceae bacterium]|nr:hypothetical protein [Balneolaceae bacterium]